MACILSPDFTSPDFTIKSRRSLAAMRGINNLQALWLGLELFPDGHEYTPIPWPDFMDCSKIYNLWDEPRTDRFLAGTKITRSKECVA